MNDNPDAVNYGDRRVTPPGLAAEAPHVQPANKGEMMEQRLAARIPLTLFTINLTTGKLTPLLHSTDWVNHLLFSPADPTLLMYCHEGPWQKVDRIWMIHTDGTPQHPHPQAPHRHGNRRPRVLGPRRQNHLVRLAAHQGRGLLPRRLRSRHRQAHRLPHGPQRLVHPLQPHHRPRPLLRRRRRPRPGRQGSRRRMDRALPPAA